MTYAVLLLHTCITEGNETYQLAKVDLKLCVLGKHMREQSFVCQVRGGHFKAGAKVCTILGERYDDWIIFKVLKK